MNNNNNAYAKEREQDYVWYFYSLTEDAAGSEDWPGEILRIYDEHWDKVKEAIRRDYWHTLADGGVGKPTPDDMMSLHDSNQMLYSNIIYYIDDALLNAKRYDDRVAFARDCLEIFDLRDGKENLNLMNFQLAVGEALSDGGHIEESDAYYEKLLADNPDNGYMIANYVLTLKLRGEKDRARALLEQHISPDMEPVKENDMLFERAWEMYEELGDHELAEHYRELQRSIDQGHKYTDSELSSILESLGVSHGAGQTVVRSEKKIYPNDPCPCGSGKKYKKCCGKK